MIYQLTDYPRAAAFNRIIRALRVVLEPARLRRENCLDSESRDCYPTDIDWASAVEHREYDRLQEELVRAQPTTEELRGIVAARRARRLFVGSGPSDTNV